MAGRRRSYSRKTGRKTYVLGNFGEQKNFYLEERRRRSAYGRRSRKDIYRKPEKRSRRKEGGGWKWRIAACLLLTLLMGGAAFGWVSYQGRVYKERVFEAGVEVRAEDFRKKEGVEVRFAKDSGAIDTRVPGEYKVKLKSGFFTYDCTAVVQDTVLPVAETAAVYCEEGQRVEAAAFVLNIQDETDVTIEYVQEPDFNYSGVQPVEIALTDAGNNRIQLSSQLISQLAVESITLEAGAPFPQLPEFMKRQVDGAVFLTDIASIDTKMPGDYTIEFQADGIPYTSKLLVRDTAPPVVEVRNRLTIYNSEQITWENVVKKAEDVTALTYAFETEPDYTLIGEQTLALIVTDAGGNAVREEFVLKIREDKRHPAVTGIVGAQ